MAREWSEVNHDETYNANEILEVIVNYDELDKDVTQALCLRYSSHQMTAMTVINNYNEA